MSSLEEIIEAQPFLLLKDLATMVTLPYYV